jgi:hypothetical protein
MELTLGRRIAWVAQAAALTVVAVSADRYHLQTRNTPKSHEKPGCDGI